METDASIDRRDAFAATVALLVLAILWVVLRLYWQGALLLTAGLALGYFGWFRLRGTATADGDHSTGAAVDAKAESAPSQSKTQKSKTQADRGERSKSEQSKSKGGRKKGKKKKR